MALHALPVDPYGQIEQQRKYPRVNGRTLCADYMMGTCRGEGKACPKGQLHLDKPERPPCPTFALLGRCRYADAECLFPHVYAGVSENW